MSGLAFYLGTHLAAWLWSDELPAGTPLFVSHRRLDGKSSGRRKSAYPRGRHPWALDSGGFTELQKYGSWDRVSPEAYVAAVRRYDDEIGGLEWAAPQDWMCEPIVISGGVANGQAFVGTGLSVLEHQRRTVANFVRLEALWGDDSESPFMPVLQGYTVEDYLRCWDMYDAAGVELANYPVVGVGSVCRRQDTSEIGEVMAALRGRDPGLPIHGFGVKSEGVALYGEHMETADSLAWSKYARHDRAPMPGCEGRGHINCANCSRYALAWRARLLEAIR